MESYSEERVASAREIIDESSKSTRFMTPPSTGYQLLRDATLSLSLSQSFVRPLFHWRTSRPHHYVNSSLNSFEEENRRSERGIANGSPVRNIKLGDNEFLMDHMAASFYLFHLNRDGIVPQVILDAKQSILSQGIPFETGGGVDSGQLWMF